MARTSMISGRFFRPSGQRIGASLSLICAIHCLAMPFVISFLPSVGEAFLHNTWLEIGLLGSSMVLAALNLVSDYRRHHGRKLPLAILFLALPLMSFAHMDEHMEHVLSPAAGFMVFGAFLINWRLTRKTHTCVHHGKHSEG